jgi:hypothetical protein
VTPQSPQHAHKGFEHVSRIIPAVVGATLLMGLAATAALASPADCQSVDLLRRADAEGMRNWKNTSLPLTLTAQRDPLHVLVREAAPLLRSTRFNRWIGSGNTCWSQSFRRNPPVNQALMRSVGKASVKTIARVMKVPARAYNGKSPVLQTRTILPESIITLRDRLRASSDRFRNTLRLFNPLSRALSQARAVGPFLRASLPLFEDRPILPTDAFRMNSRLSVNEALRMNMTTTRALRGGNCASGCP